jgi:hypothetical protein
MFYCKTKAMANLKAFREQAVEDGDLSSIGFIRDHEGSRVIAADGTLWEWYDDGPQGMCFKQLGSNMSFTTQCHNLPFPDYHN